MATSIQSQNLCEVLSESKRIINANSGHFLALSALFLLPYSFAVITYTSFQSDVVITPTLYILYALFFFFFSICSVGTITYSTYHGFYGTPVNLSSAIKSLLHSFIPLASTTLALQILIVLIFLVFAVFVRLVIKVAQILGFAIDYNSVVFWVVVSVVLVEVVLQVNWGLASVIAVVELKWGFEPLWRSANLVKGMRTVSFGLLLIFSVPVGLFMWGYSMSTANAIRLWGWKSWGFVLQAVVGSSFVAMVLLHYLAANTVLFLYCKASHGGVAAQVAAESDLKYVSLPLDDDKLPFAGVYVDVVHSS